MRPGSSTCCRASKTQSIRPAGDFPLPMICVITPLDTTMPSDASAAVPVNVASGCLIHVHGVSVVNVVTLNSNDALSLFVR